MVRKLTKYLSHFKTITNYVIKKDQIFNATSLRNVLEKSTESSNLSLGDLKWCRWYIHYDCSDTVVQGGSVSSRADAFQNKLLRFGIFERDSSQQFAFKLIGFNTLDRVDWYDNLLKDGVLASGDGAHFNVRTRVQYHQS